VSSCPTHRRPRGDLERVADLLEQIANAKIVEAGQLLAEAAALFDETRAHTEMPLGISPQLWFLARALCAEHALHYDRMVERARTYASEAAAAQQRD
jgi:hypothetical protein